MSYPPHNNYYYNENRKREAAEAELAGPDSDFAAPKKLSFWERGYKSLVIFHQKHGHTRVPYRYDEDPTLGTWTARQRKLRDQLTDDQRQRLEALGFSWQSTQDMAWMEKFQRLKAFYERQGHSCVPTTFLDDPELGEWTAKQRQKETQGRLSQERRELLDTVKFVFRINKFVRRKSTAREDKKWWEQLERLIHFLLEHGHTLVPFQYFADKSLGRWVNEQRCQNMRGLLREDRHAILSSIGFVWKVSSRKGLLTLADDADDNSQWAYSFRQLVEYKVAHGSFPVQGDPTPLGQWASQQRILMEQGEMEEMRAQRLSAIGFSILGADEIWESNHTKLKHDGFNKVYNLEDPCLSHWVIVQRYLYKKELLDQDKKFRLFEINGWVWDSTPLNLPKPESKHVLKERKRRNSLNSSSSSSTNNKENALPTSVTGTTAKVLGTAAPVAKQTVPEPQKPQQQPIRIKKRGAQMVPLESSDPVARPSMDTNEIEGFCGLLAIASSFRAKENPAASPLVKP